VIGGEAPLRRLRSRLDDPQAFRSTAIMIRFTHVTKEYPRAGAALSDVSFHLAKGEFVFLTGPSGAGKSTVLRLLYFEERPNQGEVRVSGISSRTIRTNEIAKLRRRLGIVFQDFRLLADRTAEANVAFALEVTGAQKSAIPGKVARLLTHVGLASKAGRYPHELSGGEQQRVAIARALANDPFLLIADEPTGNLDDRATAGVYQLLREVSASGTAVIMATHNQQLIRRGDFRLLELQRGRLVYDSAAGVEMRKEELA
jgi:cell division transport system ATP-binding protein